MKERGKHSHFLIVHSSRRVKALHECADMADRHRIAHGTSYHAQHCEPHVRVGLRWIATCLWYERIIIYKLHTSQI